MFGAGISTSIRNRCVCFFPHVCCNTLKVFLFQWWLEGTAKCFVSIHLICSVCFHIYCLSNPTKIEIWCWIQSSRGHTFWEVMPLQNNLHIISSVESASFAIATSHWNQQFYLSTPTMIRDSKSVLANILLLLFLRKWNNYPLSYSNFYQAPYSAVLITNIFTTMKPCFNSKMKKWNESLNSFLQVKLCLCRKHVWTSAVKRQLV